MCFGGLVVCGGVDKWTGETVPPDCEAVRETTDIYTREEKAQQTLSRIFSSHYFLIRPPQNALSRRFLKSPGWAKRRNHRSRDLCAWECACVLVCVGGRALRGKFWLCRQTMFSCIAVKVSNNFWVRFFHNSTVRASLFLHPSHFSLWICT